MLYWLFMILMEIGYIGLTFYSPDLKGKVIGILLAVVNFLIFLK